jgi:hypothetical protein
VALTEYMNACFSDGETAFVGSRLLSAISFVKPEWGRPRDLLFCWRNKLFVAGRSWLRASRGPRCPGRSSAACP